MAPWLSRLEREALGLPGHLGRSSGDLSRASTRASSGDLSRASERGRRSGLSRGDTSGASTPRPKRRRVSERAVEERQTDGKAESVEELVGPVLETRAAHLLRHGGGRRTCPRCWYYSRGAAWTATYGSCMALTGPRRRIVWLAERPARLGGAWALGCVFCASHECRSAAPGAARRGKGPSLR